MSSASKIRDLYQPLPFRQRMEHTPIDLDDIPDEVLVQIFDRSNSDISTGSLLNLSLSSRRLHFLCLPIYLARFGIHKPLERCEIILRSPQHTPGSIDALTGLRIALFIPSIENLVCRFHVPGDVEDFLYIANHLRRLQEFISSVSFVHSVLFQFGNKRCGCCSELDPGETLDNDLKEWSNAMASVLNLLLEKSCGNMTLAGGKYMAHSYVMKVGNKFQNDSEKTGALAAIKRLVRKGKFARLGLPRSGNWINVLQGENWEFKRAPDTGKAIVLTSLSKAARTTSSLQSLTISSMMFGVPPLLHWMVSVLRLPTTQALTLRNTPLTRKGWLVVLSVIAEHCSHLTELKLTRLRQLHALDVVYFVGRFPQLKSFHIGRSVESYNSDDLVSFPDFLFLKSLHAPAPWLLKLLLSQQNPLQRLETISIAYTFTKGNITDWLKISSNSSIPNLLGRLPRLSSVSLKIVLGKNPGWRMLEDVNGFNTGEPPRLLKNVDRLSLMIDYASRTGDIQLGKILPKWVAKFYGLRYLSIKATPTAMSDAEVSVLAMLIVKEGRSPSIEKFEVNGVDVDPMSVSQTLDGWP